jgi:hypothetical protein
MRKTPQKPIADSKQALIDQAGRQSKSEKTKLIAMLVGLLLVVVAYFMSDLQGQKHLDKQGDLIGQEPGFNVEVVVDALDMSSIVDKILDNRPEDRVLLSSEITKPLTDYVQGKNAGHFHAMGLELLDAEKRQALEEAPSEHRGQAYRTRGKLSEIKSRKRMDGKTEYRGWLTGEDGSATHFVSMGVPKEITLTGSMRMDGVFLKLYSAEGHEQEWVNGPLLVCAELVNSFSSLTADDTSPEGLARSFARIKDDTAQASTGLDRPVTDIQWSLMEFAKTEAYQAIDWDNAVELTNDTMSEILTDGSLWRGRSAGDPDPHQANERRTELPALAADLIPIPIRIPISRNMGINTYDPGENPARLDSITEGWIGNMTWTNQAGVVYFVLGEHRPELTDRKQARLIEGRGFFVKNHNYMSKDKGTHTAPFFVMTEMNSYTPGEDNSAENLMWAILIITLVLVVAFPVLLMRDRKKSEELHQDLVRRKQERRRRLAATDQ